MPARDVWKLYQEQARTFRQVFASLRSKGLRLAPEEEADLIHEFLIERAGPALGTFQPERGELEQWLFVVFRRFVVGSLTGARHLERAVVPIDDVVTVSDNDYDATHDLAVLESVVRTLPSRERRALRTYLRAQASVRQTAEHLRVPREEATELIDRAITSIGKALGIDSGLAAEQVRKLMRAN